VAAAAFLDDRDRLTHFALQFEIAQQHHSIREIARIDGRGHLRSDEALVRPDQYRGDAILTEIRQELMQLNREETFLGHRVQVAVQAVDHDDTRLVDFDCAAHRVRELAGRELRGIDLLHGHAPRIEVYFEIHAEAGTPREQDVQALVEDEQGASEAALGGGDDELRRDRGLAGTRRPHQERARAVLNATAEQIVERRNAARQPCRRRRRMVLACDQARKDLEPAPGDDVVVIAPTKIDPAELDDGKPASLGTVLGIELLEAHHAVRDALKLQVRRRAGQIVEQEHRARRAGEELLEGEDLAPVTQRIAGDQSQFGQRVEDDSRRSNGFDVVQDRLGGFGELDFGRMKHRVLVFGAETLLAGRDFANSQPGERPAMRRTDRAQLLLGLRKRHVEHRFAAAHPLEQELQGERRLARAGHALDQVHATRSPSAAQDIVETFDPGACLGKVGRIRLQYSGHGGVCRQLS